MLCAGREHTAICYKHKQARIVMRPVQVLVGFCRLRRSSGKWQLRVGDDGVQILEDSARALRTDIRVCTLLSPVKEKNK